MLEFLIISFLVARFFCRNLWQDALWSWRSEDPPSYRREITRREERGEPGPGRRYMANAWRDAVATAEEHRQRRREKSARKRREKWEAEDLTEQIERDEEEAHRINDGIRDEETEEGSPSAEPAPTAPAPPLAPVPAPESERPTEIPKPDKPEGGRLIAFPTQIPTEENMTEITGLQTAITYASGQKSAAEAAANGVEPALANLAANGVSGAAPNYFVQAAEHLRMAAALFASGQQELLNHLAVKEAYEANKGAGTREFNTSE